MQSQSKSPWPAIVVALLIIAGIVAGIFYWQSTQERPGIWYVFTTAPTMAEPLSMEVDLNGDEEAQKNQLKAHIAEMLKTVGQPTAEKREVGRVHYSNLSTGELRGYPYVILQNPVGSEFPYTLAKHITDKDKIYEMVRLRDSAEVQLHVSGNMLQELDVAENERERKKQRR